MTNTASPGSVAFLLRYVRQRPWHFGGLLVLVVVASACAVGVQYGMKLIVDAMAASNREKAALALPLAVFVGLIALENILWRCAGWLGCNTIVRTGVDVRLDLFEHLSGHPIRYFAQHFSGALGNRVTSAAGGVGSIFSTLTWNILPPCIDFIGAVIVLLTIRPAMAYALVAFVAVVALLIVRVGSGGRALHQAYAEEGARVGGELVDVVSNIWTVKAFSAGRRERGRFEREFAIEALAQQRSWLYLERTRVLHDLCLWAMASSMLIWAALEWRSGHIGTGDVVIVSALTFRILHGSRDLAFALVGISQQFGTLAETLRAVMRPHSLSDPAEPRALKPSAGSLLFDHVHYRFANGQSVFEDLCLHIPAGQRVGIVGPSGAGKSTLLALIQRLDDVQQGRVLLDGHPLDAYLQDSLRDCLAVVPQDIALFNRSVMENLRYSRPRATNEEVHEAARMAKCDDFIRALPQGYDTLIGERGVRLSGGQRQRLSLARAFLKNAPILLLDEATSALDTQSEGAIQLALQQLTRNRTVIAVAHRLATVSTFDRVIVLVEGRIVQDGAPLVLRNTKGLFRTMWETQATGFADVIAAGAAGTP